MRCAVAGSRDPSWRDVCLTRGLGAQQQQPGGRPAGRPLAVSTAPALLPDPGPCCLPPRRPFPSLSRQAQCLVLSGCRAPTFTPLRGLGALGSCPVIVPFLSCHQAPSAPGGRGDWNEAQVPSRLCSLPGGARTLGCWGGHVLQRWCRASGPQEGLWEPRWGCLWGRCRGPG